LGGARPLLPKPPSRERGARRVSGTGRGSLQHWLEDGFAVLDGDLEVDLLAVFLLQLRGRVAEGLGDGLVSDRGRGLVLAALAVDVPGVELANPFFGEIVGLGG